MSGIFKIPMWIFCTNARRSGSSSDSFRVFGRSTRANVVFPDCLGPVKVSMEITQFGGHWGYAAFATPFLLTRRHAKTPRLPCRPLFAHRRFAMAGIGAMHWTTLCGPIAMRYVIDEPGNSSTALPSSSLSAR
ncbi:MAG: hypothetical protein AB8B97_21265 [Granulosicoccus sp.]